MFELKCRKVSPDFPFTDPTICFIVVNSTTQEIGKVPSKREELLACADLLESGQIKLYAVWPGKTRSDFFSITDPEKLRSAHGAYRAL